MKEYENNAYFWQKVDTLYFSSEVTPLKKKGEHHDEFKNLIYPANYGKMNANEANAISVYFGSLDKNKITGLIVAADILSKEIDVKLLAGCNEEEEEEVLRFLNQTAFQKTVLIKRGNAIPDWADIDN